MDTTNHIWSSTNQLLSLMLHRQITRCLFFPGETGTATEYDAYVVYADEDFTFVREMIDQLETKFGLRLCISNRDMLAGSAEFQAVAALIKKR